MIYKKIMHSLILVQYVFPQMEDHLMDFIIPREERTLIRVLLRVFQRFLVCVYLNTTFYAYTYVLGRVCVYINQKTINNGAIKTMAINTSLINFIFQHTHIRVTPRDTRLTSNETIFFKGVSRIINALSA